MIFALYGLYWLYRHHKGALALVMALGALLHGTTILMQPDWIGAWLAQTKTYSATVNLPWLMPLAIVVLLIVWRFHMVWWAKAALVQTVLFPLAGVYSLLPLLLAWFAFSPPLALVGTSVSLLWALLPLPLSVGMIWIFILLPLLLTILWEGRPQAFRPNALEGGAAKDNIAYLKPETIQHPSAP